MRLGYFTIASSTGERLAGMGVSEESSKRSFLRDSNSLNASVSSKFNCTYMDIPMSITLERNGIRHPQAWKNSSDTEALIMMKARFAKITPTGAPAWANAP